jgi:hypothetical protein
MKIIINTLVDITETNRNRNDKSLEYKQQSNFNTLLQTVGLRVNPLYTRSPEVTTIDTKPLQFGSSIKDKQSVWQFVIDVEYSNAIYLEELLDIFNLLPVNTGLLETVKNNKGIFYTKDKKFTNITFEIIE